MATFEHVHTGHKAYVDGTDVVASLFLGPAWWFARGAIGPALAMLSVFGPLYALAVVGGLVPLVGAGFAAMIPVLVIVQALACAALAYPAVSTGLRRSGYREVSRSEVEAAWKRDGEVPRPAPPPAPIAPPLTEEQLAQKKREEGRAWITLAILAVALVGTGVLLSQIRAPGF